MVVGEVLRVWEKEGEYMDERVEGVLKMVGGGSVIDEEIFYYRGEYKNEEY